MMKRSFDFTAALIGLSVLFPVVLIVSIWIKLDSSGPVFYRAERGGRGGKPFRIFKFRSMVTNADKIGGPSTSGADSRMTRSGRFIRSWKLDEVPQLINVLKGEMSLVGPRPEVMSKVSEYNEEEKKTLELRPGITDWASIWNSDEGGILEGAVDADSVYEEVIRPTKIKLQLFYRETRSFIGDLKIIFGTLFCIVNKHWVPKELQDYPRFKELRSKALVVIERQKKEQQEKDV
jgi:lipopolysaccharide/colanic/teichoic acid biosynthesis glycosyltransferase